MRVEIKIDHELTEPYAVLHIAKLTDDVGALLDILENAVGMPSLITAKKMTSPMSLRRHRWRLSVPRAAASCYITVNPRHFRLPGRFRKSSDSMPTSLCVYQNRPL